MRFREVQTNILNSFPLNLGNTYSDLAYENKEKFCKIEGCAYEK